MDKVDAIFNRIFPGEANDKLSTDETFYKTKYTQLLVRIKEVISDTVVMNIMIAPIVLDCGHAYSLETIKHWISSVRLQSGQIATCPICQRPILSINKSQCIKICDLIDIYHEYVPMSIMKEKGEIQKKITHDVINAKTFVGEMRKRLNEKANQFIAFFIEIVLPKMTEFNETGFYIRIADDDKKSYDEGTMDKNNPLIRCIEPSYLLKDKKIYKLVKKGLGDLGWGIKKITEDGLFTINIEANEDLILIL
jgi:hypothetical protein